MKQLLLAGICTISLSAFSQNLIKNSEFATNKKVTYRAQINKADGWSDANGGSVDLFTSNSCETNAGIPQNFMGNQASSGNYAGFTAYYDDMGFSLNKSLQNKEITGEKGYSKYSEYLQGELVEALVAGQIYSFTINVSLAEKSGRAVNGLGAYFSNEKLNHENNKALSYVPQVKSTDFISDKNEWSTISGVFTAKGGERYVTIGAFEGSFTVKSTVIPKQENDNKRAYYYVNGAALTVGGVRTLSSDELIYIEKVSEKVFFATGSFVLSNEAKTELDGLAKLLKSHPEVKASIKGHTDSDGSIESNVILSKNRANSVKDYLASQGVDEDHLRTEAHGETDPIATNATSEGKAINRHVLIQTSLYTVITDKK